MLGLIGAALFADLVLFHRYAHEIGMRQAAVTSAVWGALGLGLAGVVWGTSGRFLDPSNPANAGTSSR